MSVAAATFAASFVALYVAHQVGDHWVQTQTQAERKGLLGWEGRLACARHAAALTLTKLAVLLSVAWLCDLRLRPMAVAAALAVGAVSHYWADRRTTIAGLASRLGKRTFYQLGAPRPGRGDNPSLGTGAYALDQSWHVGWLLVEAALACW